MGERGAALESHRPLISRPPTLNQRYPWLVICDEDERQMFYSITQKRYYERHIPELHNQIIVSSQQGWLFLTHNESNDCSVFNMFTLETRQLPPLAIDCKSSSVLSTSSTKIDESCRIIVIRDLLIHSCYLGSGEFDKRGLRGLNNDWQENVWTAVKFDGKLYAWSMFSYDLAVADFADSALHFTRVFRGHESFWQMLDINNDTKFYLIDSCGELLFVYTNIIDHDGLDIKIYKADFDNKEWVVVPCLSDRTLFLDPYKGLSSLPEKKENEMKGLSSSSPALRNNCVYYVKGAGDRSLYMYDWKDKTTTEYLPCPTISNDNSSLFWVM